MSFVNIAEKSKVTFSSMSQWSTEDDCREIVTAEHNRNFSFHTDKEYNPWVELDLGAKAWSKKIEEMKALKREKYEVVKNNFVSKGFEISTEAKKLQDMII